MTDRAELAQVMVEACPVTSIMAIPWNHQTETERGYWRMIAEAARAWVAAQPKGDGKDASKRDTALVQVFHCINCATVEAEWEREHERADYNEVGWEGARTSLYAERAGLATQAQRIAALEDMLRLVQWSASSRAHGEVCPRCGRTEGAGHNLVCGLGALLAPDAGPIG